MDPRLLQYYNLELQHLRETGAEFAAAVSQDCGPARDARAGSGRSLRGAAARRRRVPGGARAAQARRRIPALHAGAARDRLSALPGADAVDAGRAAQARSERSEPGRRPHGAARQHAVRPAGRRRCDGVRVSHGARRHAVAGRDRVGELLLVRARSAAQRAADRAAHQGRRADPAEDDGGPEVRADGRSTGCCFYLAGRDDVANKLYELCLASRPRRAGAAARRARRGGTSSFRRRRSSRSASPTTRRCCR